MGDANVAASATCSRTAGIGSKSSAHSPFWKPPPSVLPGAGDLLLGSFAGKLLGGVVKDSVAIAL